MKLKWRILVLGLLTVILFPILAFLLHWIVEGHYKTIGHIFQDGAGLFLQIVCGLGIGLLFGFLAWEMVNSNYMRPVLNKYGNIVKTLKLNTLTIVFLSLCAGVGEEIFFRGVLQDYLGVVVTAILFVIIHGYLNPFDKIIFSYGLLMTVLIVLIGFMDKYLGLFSAMAAHTMIDVVLFYKLTITDFKTKSRA